jgi:hypothetical protein
MSRRDRAALRPQPARNGTEFHPTPDPLIDALIEYMLSLLPLEPAIWECAAGDGRLASAIAATGRHVVATDIAPRHLMCCSTISSPGRPRSGSRSRLLTRCIAASC